MQYVFLDVSNFDKVLFLVMQNCCFSFFSCIVHWTISRNNFAWKVWFLFALWCITRFFGTMVLSWSTGKMESFQVIHILFDGIIFLIVYFFCWSNQPKDGHPSFVFANILYFIFISGSFQAHGSTLEHMQTAWEFFWRALQLLGTSGAFFCASFRFNFVFFWK